MTTLSLGAFSLIPFLILHRIQFFGKYLRIPVIFLFIINLFSIISSFFSETSFTSHLWGQFGRNNGLLTLISLSLLFLSGLLSDEMIRKKTIDSLQILSVPLSFYGGVQYLGLDPVPWAQTGVFSTLGNINFASAFFALSAISIFSQYVLITGTTRFRNLKIIYGIYLTVLTVTTGSIQGPIMITVGLLLLFYIRFWEVERIRKPLVVLAVLSLAPIVTILLGFFGRGPLGNFLVQQTLLFRSDYWRAGLKMIVDAPLLGNGPDSYGDWYTRSRDLLAVERTGPQRISNTAHNVFIDIGVGGGFVVLISILALVIVPVLVSGLRLLSDEKSKLPGIDKVVFILVVVYFLQASISINQIGLAVWGWLFLGFLWSISLNKSSLIAEANRVNAANVTGKSEKSRASGIASLPPGLHLLRIVCVTIAILLCTPPFRVDALFAKGLQETNQTLLVETSKSLGATQVHAEKALAFLRSSNSEGQLKFALYVTERFPSSIYAWRVVRELSSGMDKSLAEERLRLLDPLNTQVIE